MKKYGFEPRAIEVKDKEGNIAYSINAIELGETGRGRIYTLVPCTEGAEFVEPAVTKSGRPRLNKTFDKDGWVARLNSIGGYIRGACGHVKIQSGVEFKVVARGAGAFDDAGRIGGWDDVLISTPINNFFTMIKPTRGSKWYLQFKEDGSTVSMTQEEFNLYIDAKDIKIEFVNV